MAAHLIRSQRVVLPDGVRPAEIRVENGKIAEEIGLDDGVTALTQLGLIRAA